MLGRLISVFVLILAVAALPLAATAMHSKHRHHGTSTAVSKSFGALAMGAAHSHIGLANSLATDVIHDGSRQPDVNHLSVGDCRDQYSCAPQVIFGTQHMEIFQFQSEIANSIAAKSLKTADLARHRRPPKTSP